MLNIVKICRRGLGGWLILFCLAYCKISLINFGVVAFFLISCTLKTLILSPNFIPQATSLGAFMSLCAISVMGILFLSETLAFFRVAMGTAIALDENDQPQIRLNFNITLLDLHCDYVSVDVWDTLGTNRQNVTKNVEKWQLDEDGQRRIFSGRNREQREVVHEEHTETLEELHEDGEQAVELTPETFKEYLESNEMSFIDMYAP
mgnify:CR=1 FL=1